MAQKSLLDPTFITALIDMMKIVFPTRDDVRTIVKEALDTKIKNLPTKDEFFTRMDNLSVEIKAAREELTLHQGQHDRHDQEHERIRKHIKLPALA